jgi:hypothetical protein
MESLREMLDFIFIGFLVLSTIIVLTALNGESKKADGKNNKTTPF